MDVRRLLLYLAAGGIAVLLAQGLTGRHADLDADEVVISDHEFERAERRARPGEVVWSNWKDSGRQEAPPVENAVRDVYAAEMRFEDLPDRVRNRIEADFKGLDVVLPNRAGARRDR